MSYCENSTINDGELLTEKKSPENDKSQENNKSPPNDKLSESEYYEDFKKIKGSTQEEIDEYMINEERQSRNNWYSYGIGTVYNYSVDTVSSYGKRIISENETLGMVSGSVLNYIPSWMCGKKEREYSNFL